MGTIRCMRFLMSVTLLTTAFVSQATADTPEKLLQGNRRIAGTVEEVKGDQARVNTGEVQPRFIPLKPSREKGLPAIKEGDKVEIIVNDQNLVVDYHLVGASDHPKTSTEHQIIKGQIAKPMAVGHEQAVIRTKDGKESSYEIGSQARSKMASIPVGVEAVFMVDETNKIVDVTFKDEKAAKQAGKMPEKKSPPKGTP
jgi:hypothetical protein